MSRFTTMRPTPASSARSALWLLLAALTGCAAYSPGDLKPGTTEAALRERMGEPTGRYGLADGATRLEFARGPMGKHTYMVELDATGLVRGWEQVLTERRFDTVMIDTPLAEVRKQFGRPSGWRVGWRGVGEVWAYRFESVFCRWFVIWFVDGRVREANYDIDPQCEDHRQDNK